MLSYAWGTLPEPRDVARALEADPDIAGVVMIQHETSVGLLNPVRRDGRLCRPRGVTLIVDAVSALGAEDVDVVRDNVDICYSSANKCLHSVSGVSFLCVAPHVWERIADIAPRVYYLDMLRTRRYLRGAAPDAVHARRVVVLRARDGARRARRAGRRAGAPGALPQARAADPARAANLGFESFTNTGRESHTISTLRLPDGVTVEGFYDSMKQRGFIVYRVRASWLRGTSRSRTWASCPTRRSTRSSRQSPTSSAARAPSPRRARGA